MKVLWERIKILLLIVFGISQAVLLTVLSRSRNNKNTSEGIQIADNIERKINTCTTKINIMQKEAIKKKDEIEKRKEERDEKANKFFSGF